MAFNRKKKGTVDYKSPEFLIGLIVCLFFIIKSFLHFLKMRFLKAIKIIQAKIKTLRSNQEKEQN